MEGTLKDHQVQSPEQFPVFLELRTSLPVLSRGLVAAAARALLLNCVISWLQRHVTRFIPLLTTVLKAFRARQGAINEMFFPMFSRTFILAVPYTWGLSRFLLCSRC